MHKPVEDSLWQVTGGEFVNMTSTSVSSSNAANQLFLFSAAAISPPQALC